MAEVKWIKLDVDMFSNPKIKRLRRMPDGNNILLIWVMLLTMAGRCNASGMIFITQNVPYTVEDLADELGFSVDTIKLALLSLENLGMITTGEKYDLEITNWCEHQSGDKLDEMREKNRIRQQNYREKQKVLQEENRCNVTDNVTSNVTSLISISNSNNNINNNINNNNNKEYIEEIVNYLNKVCGTKYKPTTKVMKEHINARLKEGFTVDDFKTVIDKKFAEWGNDYKMSQYLRPQTLFSTKFEGYLNQKGGTSVGSGMERHTRADEEYEQRKRAIEEYIANGGLDEDDDDE